MEKITPATQETEASNLDESIRYIAGAYIGAAERYLDEGDPLRESIVDFYANREDTARELSNVLAKKDDAGIEAYLQSVRSFTENPSRFIERMEKLHELQDVHMRRRKLAQNDSPATKEEYELGAYAGVLESQVRDAVFAAQRKGYRTFQSGFREKSERQQFMDFYTRNIPVPKEAIEYLKGLSIELKVEKFDDRTTLTLLPTGPEPVRLAQWKEVWDTLIDMLPEADSELVPGMKATGEHLDFRGKQDSVRG